MNKVLKYLFFAALLSLCMAYFQLCAFAVPCNGEVFELKQPDGSIVKVKVFGDEFYRKMESLDGYTLVRDPSTKWVCYAKLDNRASSFISTGINYTGKLDNKSSEKLEKQKIPKNLDLNNDIITKIVDKEKKERNDFLNKSISTSQSGFLSSVSNTADSSGTLFSPQFAPGASATSITAQAAPVTVGNVLSGEIKGLTILVDFPKSATDRTGDRTIPVDEIEKALNQVGYTNNGNNGSVRDYFYDVSGGRLTYTNTVLGYYTAKNVREYYDNPTTDMVPVLIDEALQYYASKGYDFSNLTKYSDGVVKCLNILYSGDRPAEHAKGLWPKSDILSYNGAKVYNNVKFLYYEITDLQKVFQIGTMVHENGHMMCAWSDTYDYDKDPANASRGTGEYDLMSSGGGPNPPLPNPYFRIIKSGWGSPKSLNDYTMPITLTASGNSPDVYIYRKINGPFSSDNYELFMIENYRSTGRRTKVIDNGLLIWHIDERISNNNNEQMTPEKHYKISVEQADGLYELERNKNYGEAGDLFHYPWKDRFTSNTPVNSNLWDGKKSGLNIINIGPAKETMTFTFDPGLVTPKNARVISRTGNKVTLGWDPVAGANGYHIFADFKNSTAPAVRVNIGITSTTSVSINMAENSIYNFYVEAIRSPDDYVTSEPSNPIEISTDAIAPTAPTNLTCSDIRNDMLDLSWNASTDNIGVLGYKIYSGTTEIATTTSTTYTIRGLTLGTTYSFTVKAYDTKCISPASIPVSVMPKLVTPQLWLGSFGGTSRTIEWTSSEGADKYYLYAMVQTSPGNTSKLDLGYHTSCSYSATLTPDCNYNYYVQAISTSTPHASSDISLQLFISFDVTKPLAPTNLTYSNVTTSTANLNWTASYDNLLVDKYNIYVNGLLYSSSNTNSCRLTNLTPGTLYYVKVVAIDKGNNMSDPSDLVVFATSR